MLAQRPGERIAALEHGGRRYWLKQAERHESLRKRLTKGDSRQALRREGETLRKLAGQQVPVPEVVLEGPDHLLLSDCGPTLEDIARAPGFTPGSAVPGFAAAGMALGGLHAKDMLHGRASIKDLCWDGARIAFIDFEVRPGGRQGAGAAGRELANFVFRTHFVAQHAGCDLGRELQAFLDAYSKACLPAHLRAARRLAAWRWWWMVPLAAPVVWLTAPGKAPDFRAIAPTMRVLRGLGT